MNQEKWLELRKKAEQLLKSGPPPVDSESAENFRRLVEELNIAQVELELQNHELSETQNILENLTKEYTDLFDFSPIGKVILDENFIVQKVNLTFAALVKAIRSRIVGTPIQQWISPNDYPLTHEKLVLTQKRDLKSSLSWTGNLKSSKREDIPVRFLTRKTVGTYNNGLYLVVIDESYDTQIRQENALALERLQMSQILDNIKLFSRSMAHEVNNVLAAIMGYAQVAQLNTDLPPKLKHYFIEILNAARRGKDLLEQGVSLTISQSLQENEEATELDLTAIIQEALEKTAAFRPDRIEVSLHFRPTRAPFRAPRHQLFKIFEQLLLNAFEAMREKGNRLTISVEERGYEDVASLPLHPMPKRDDYLYCCITDDGEGIETRHLERVFEPFFTTRTRHQGKGLGLFLVKNILTSLGGSLFLKSSPGEGTEVHLFFPVGRIRPVPPGDPFPFGGLENSRISYLDNDVAVIQVFQEFFEIFRMEYRVYRDLQTFLEDFNRQPTWADVVLCDYDLGEHRGSDILRLILQQRPDLRVGLVTSDSHGITDFPVLAKPVELEDAYRFLKRLLTHVPNHVTLD